MKKELLLFLLLLFTNSLMVTSVFGMDNHGISMMSTANMIFNDTIVDLPDTVYLQTSDCNAPAALCIDIPINDIFNYQILINDTSFYQNGIQACNLDTILSYNYRQLVETDGGQPISGPYSVQSWEVNGMIFTGDFLTISDLVDSLNTWDPTGIWVDDPTTKRIRGGNSDNTYSDLAVFVAQIGVTPILTKNQQLRINGSQLFFNNGTTKVTLSTTGPAPVCVDSFRVSVACIQPDTIVIDTLFPGVTDTICLDFSELLLPFTSITNECASDGNVQYNLINGNSCVEFTTLTPGIDSACIVVCDGRGLCDTTTFIIDVQDPNPTRIIITELDIIEGQSDVFCIDTTRIMGVDTAFTICDSAEEFVDFTFDEASLCLNYTGLVAGGVDTFCLVICDEMMLCDTNYVYINTRRDGPGLVNDTLYLNQSTTICDFDLINLDGPVTEIINFCTDVPMAVDFMVDDINFCLDIASLMPGQDTACLQFMDAAGNLDTIFYIVDVLNPDPEVIVDDIRINEPVEYCLDTTQLGDNILDSIFICNDFSQDNINLVTNPLSLCLEVTGTTANQTDTLCVALCDDLGSCDTTTFILTVSNLPVNSPPILVTDIDTTLINTAIEINVCENDTIPGTIENFFVLPVLSGGVGPNKGVAFDLEDCLINYIPGPDSCGLDQFTYVVENEFGLDTINSTVFIDCNSGNPGELFIFNGFSPNDDGVNDFFRINGLDNFPDHILYVYNRWGNQVLKTTDYQNDWGGTWEGADLPDGTYYYLLDDGAGETMSGYVHLHR